MDALSAMMQLWLGGLLVAWALVLLGGFVLGKPNAESTRRMTLWGRLGSSAILVVAAWSWWWQLHAQHNLTALLFALGMSLGFVGDLCMAQVFPLKNYVLGGMSAFGLGHVAYIWAGLRIESFNVQSWLVWLIVGALGWYVVVWHDSSRSRLHQVALPYALLLASTTGIATGVALEQLPMLTFAIGAALFLLSDLILATQLFNDARWRGIGDVVWFTYGPAQALIVYSMAWLL